VKAVILAGGRGTRISEESVLRPKPMIEIGGRPILWHVMKLYSQAGITDFVICLGYKGYVIKEYFANYFMHMSNVTFDLEHNKVTVHDNAVEPWRVTLLDTGDATMTGGRLKRAARFLGDQDFCMTYGDGLADIDLGGLVEFHRTQRALATVTAVQPQGRFGALFMDDAGGRVLRFEEKPPGDGSWVNGGFFVLSPKALDYVENDETIWEDAPLQALAQSGQLSAFRHTGFWHAMDTMRDKAYLEELWLSGRAPWKTWKD
jgi:glucose-1-phosphate cytidylyltransferase